MRTPITRALAIASAAAAVSAFAVSTPAVAVEEAASAPFLMPFYTELDLTGDELVDTDDLAVAVAALGTTSTDAAWPGLQAIDVDDDGVLTVADIAGLSQRIIYDDGPFELVEASVIDMQAAMNAGVTTSVEITQAYINRISAYDRVVREGGERPLNSIVTVGATTALAAAAAADAERAESGLTSMLLGIPVALKDNYNTLDMPTTAGCGCWDANQTTTDATMVEGLRAEGAVILAKASMDEFAVNLSSTFSAGQPAGSTLDVSSPYNTGRNAGGSSGGTGASIAANFAALGFGTDTGGSIRIPSNYNQLVGVRPTVGLASRDGIVPLALSQDTGGPMARSVLDAAVALDAVVGVDEADPITARQAGLVPESYTASLDASALEGTTIGYVPAMIGSNASTVRLFNAALEDLRAQGATVVELTAPEGWAAILAEGSGSGPEFNHDLQNYIDSYLNPSVAARSLAQISQSPNIIPSRGVTASNPANATYVARSLVTPEAYEAWAGPEGTHTTQLARGKQIVTDLMNAQGLDAIVYPTGNPYGTIGTNMRLSPNTGMPAVTVPMGQANATEPIPGGGANIEFLGRDFAEGDLLGLAYSYEQATHHRTTPALYPALG
ncbi:amidase family protein [Microbacterium sp. SLBN-146]|uniref:amidase family protein n=1 Tax=Microbacterium sp. SLBN-146 TaxID=2768457 RepID=UPI001170FFE9|nr:amidase family protein [Microbacterium sp. SLBN-146]TQJ31594.1 Asp-tRNA(Asn)/Glu-tRNA(Gln) amidotransferase A subunit family amidase [Microbacterium sp. SLBN-146]